MVKTLATAFVILLLCTFGAAHATSFTNLGVINGAELIYDAGQNLTWYVPQANSSTDMTWGNATNWAAGLTVDGTTAGSWTLPTTTDGFSITYPGEMGTLFHELGNSDSSFSNKGYFANIAHVGYWTSTTDTTYVKDGSRAWVYYFYGNFQNNLPKTLASYTVAVHSGELAAVPVPGAFLLFAPGLAGLAAIRRRLKK